ncbi:hypothetical protein OH799_06145 [Nocardia sp. NBC_00881]|uniref:hypothetical protein n=1 Tax=Nocardia sp. NBC_00881 TaxID=2975995 RepID=UPI0038684B47|nr:hypothetical protein OH799_06145 [Nocardia sp. NBC_00881]
MKQRASTAIGIAAVGIVAVGLLAPRAAADPDPQRHTLAPGVWCVGTTCRNDTDQTHRIDWDAICWNLGAAAEWVTVPGQHTWVGPHNWAGLNTDCPTEQEPGKWVQDPPYYMGYYNDSLNYFEYPKPRWEPGDTHKGVVRDARYTGAVPDNSQPPAPSPTQSLLSLLGLPSGSAG